jgi:LysM repeat protein
VASGTTCPICGLERIASEQSKCPQCDADLSCFRILDSLPDELVMERSGSKRQFIFMVVAILLLGLSAALALFQTYRLEEIELRALDQQSYPVGIKIDRERPARSQSMPKPDGAAGTRALSQAIEGMKKSSVLKKHPGKLDTWSGPLKGVDVWIYVATGKDTLWGISKRYYGSGSYYPVILQCNPHLSIYEIGEGVRIKILKDISQAKEIYRRITERQGNKLYWYYMVGEGDTLQSVAKKFYKTKEMAQLITAINPHMDFHAGERIKIVLE